MDRQITEIASKVISITVDQTFDDDPPAWLLAQSEAHGLTWLLAHADDGVIWGRVADKQLQMSGEAEHFPEVSPPLRAITLQQVRLFGPQAELLMWRTETGWQARLIVDEDGEPVKSYDEAHMLWGNARQPESTADFTLVADGEMGHHHALPLPTSGAQFSRHERPYRPFRLAVRHYLSQDEASGLLRVSLSRLCDLYAEEAQL